MEFVILESRFGLSVEESNSILANTRNRCSQDLVEIIQKIAHILYPEEEFEIYFLPSEPGSFRDIIKFAKKHPKGSAIVGSVTIITAVISTSVAYLVYNDSHESHKHDKKMWIIEDVKKCMELAQQKAELSEDFNVNGFPQEKIDEVCQNLSLQRKKNDRYRVLKNDANITEEETILKTSSGEILSTNNVARENFEDYIEPIVKEEGLINLEVEGIIELLGPVLKQRKEGGGIRWKGIYHGDDIRYKELQVFADGESINFYMQDTDFKNKIADQDIVFTSGDNMAVKMKITFMLSDSALKRKTVYVEKIIRFNKDVIEHKVKTTKKSAILNNQSSLF